MPVSLYFPLYLLRREKKSLPTHDAFLRQNREYTSVVFSTVLTFLTNRVDGKSRQRCFIRKFSVSFKWESKNSGPTKVHCSESNREVYRFCTCASLDFTEQSRIVKLRISCLTFFLFDNYHKDYEWFSFRTIIAIIFSSMSITFIEWKKLMIEINS